MDRRRPEPYRPLEDGGSVTDRPLGACACTGRDSWHFAYHLRDGNLLCDQAAYVFDMRTQIAEIVREAAQ